MDPSTFIIAVFCLIDDRSADLGCLRGTRTRPNALRLRGHHHRARRRELLGPDEDTELFGYFRSYYGRFFLKPGFRAGIDVRNGDNMWVMVPLMMESKLHFSVRLDYGPPEVRFERVGR